MGHIDEKLLASCQETFKLLINGTPVGEEREFLDNEEERKLYDALSLLIFTLQMKIAGSSIVKAEKQADTDFDNTCVLCETEEEPGHEH